MPRYFFHVRERDQLLLDPEGEDFDNLDIALREASISAREIVAAQVAAGECIHARQFEITTAEGKVLQTVPFRDALKLPDD